MTQTQTQIQQTTELGMAKKVAAVWLAGAMSGVIINPFELAMIQQQKYGGGLAATSARRVQKTSSSVCTNHSPPTTTTTSV